MREELLSCGFVGFPGALGAGIVHVRDRHTGGRSFLESFQARNIDRKERHPLGGECAPQLGAVRLWRRWDFGEQHAVAVGADVIERLEHQDEAVSIEAGGNRGNDQQVAPF
jgi:hypothetical protein